MRFIIVKNYANDCLLFLSLFDTWTTQRSDASSFDLADIPNELDKLADDGQDLSNIAILLRV